jgi:hypothetical protein
VWREDVEPASTFKLRKRTRMCKLQITGQGLLGGRKGVGIGAGAEIRPQFSTLQNIELFFCRPVLVADGSGTFNWEWPPSSFSVISDSFPNSIFKIFPFLECQRLKVSLAEFFPEFRIFAQGFTRDLCPGQSCSF